MSQREIMAEEESLDELMVFTAALFRMTPSQYITNGDASIPAFQGGDEFENGAGDRLFSPMWQTRKILAHIYLRGDESDLKVSLDMKYL